MLKVFKDLVKSITKNITGREEVSVLLVVILVATSILTTFYWFLVFWNNLK